MGQSACTANEGSCCDTRDRRGDALQEYEPRRGVVGETVEKAPTSAASTLIKLEARSRETNGARAESSDVQLPSDDDARKDHTKFDNDSKRIDKKEENGRTSGVQPTCDCTGQSYFSKELKELQNLPGNGPSGPRPLHRFSNGATYKGQWKGNTRHGVGEQCWPDGAKFVGDWSENMAEGLGRFTHADGDVFLGQWRGNAAQGFGIYYHRGGLTTYCGMWAEDLQHGDGTEKWEGSSTYKGQFVRGKKHGMGIYSWQDGSSYSGQWDANSINGYGHFVGHDGREYKGLWKDAAIHGPGMYSWPDGRSFCGQHVGDQKQGFGVFTWKDGRRLEGFWSEGRRNGHGITYGPKPNCEMLREGIWEDGRAL